MTLSGALLSISCLLCPLAAVFGQTVTEFTVPVAGMALTSGPDGNVWYTERASSIARITPAGVVTEFPFTIVGFPTPEPEGIVTGPDNNLWFTVFAANMIGRCTTAGVCAFFTIPTPTSGPIGITVGSDNNLWFAEQSGSKLGRITTSGVITEFPAGVRATWIAPGSDGALWYTDTAANAIGRMTTAGVVTTYPVIAHTFPYGITAGSDGALWTADSISVAPFNGRFGRVTTAGVITEFPTTALIPGLITSGSDNALWFTDENSPNIYRSTTAGVVSSVAIPGATLLFGIATGPDGNIWFSDLLNSRIGRIGVTPAAPLPPTVSALSPIGMLVLAALLAGMAVFAMRRRASTC